MSSLRIYDASNPHDLQSLQDLRSSGAIEREVDALSDSLHDLFRLDFPFVAPGTSTYERTYERYLQARWRGGDVSRLGVWVHFPWRRCLVHLPPAESFQRLRTARNRFLITDDEQQRFYEGLVGVAGLSVGLSAVSTLVLTGGAGRLRVADADVLGVTNLNRLLGSVTQLGVKKTEVCAQRIFELNPFQQLEAFDGVDDESIHSFLGSDTERLDVLVEEMDDLRMKALIRFEARSRSIPVVMATDNGDNAMVDVERFDQEPTRPLFHGTVSETDLRAIPMNPSLAERVQLASAIVGADITPRTQLSLQEVGARLPAWPQLGTAASLSGVAAAYVTRRILTGESMPSGRYHISLDAALDTTYTRDDAVSERDATRRDFVNNLDAMFGANA